MSAKKAVSGPATLRAGPWPGTLATVDPYDDAATGYLTDALNLYIPDPSEKSGAYARPGFDLSNGGAAIVTSGTPFRGQGGYAHTALDGTVTNLVAIGGRLFRVDPSLSLYEDVTPSSGVTIDGSVTTRLTFLTLGDALIISDGVNRPWIASDLASTPITGTPIDYDGAGVNWSAFTMTIYGGALVVVLNQLNGVALRSTIAWSEPGQPTLGWTQTNFSNFWTLEQTGTTPIYAIVGTNLYLYYFRERSIGAINGAIGPDLQTTSTHDAIAVNIGTLSPQSVQLYGDAVFFTDGLGRPYQLTQIDAPVPIWKHMRAVVNVASIQAQLQNATCCVSAFEPLLNLYLVAPWSPTPSALAQPTEMYAFDGETGSYIARWRIGGDVNAGIALDAMCLLLDFNDHATLTVLGSKDAAPATNGYAWTFNGLVGVPAFWVLEDGVTFVGLEDGVTMVVTEGQEDVWQDNGEVPFISATTERLGYSENLAYTVDRVTTVTTGSSPVTISLTTTTTPLTVQGTVTPTPSEDGTARAVVGAKGYGRGIQVTVSPTEANDQWSLQSVAAQVVAALASPNDP